MVDFGNTIAARSDQTNSDDLLQGPLTIKITKVSANNGSPEQPRSLHYEGDNGKPYKPNKSMRRLLVHAWGRDGDQYIGRSMTIYRDPAVRFGADEVGGIKISHMSHIENDFSIALTVTRGKKKPHHVKVLRDASKTSTAPAVTTSDYNDCQAFDVFEQLEARRQSLWPSLNADAKSALKAAADAARARLTPTDNQSDREL